MHMFYNNNQEDTIIIQEDNKEYKMVIYLPKST